MSYRILRILVFVNVTCQAAAWYKEEFQQANDMVVPDSFGISDSAIKKQSRNFKSVIKLDKNFHVYVHGDTKRIKKGVDPETGLNYYQLFFEEEY